MICKKCGVVITNDSKFCPNCGEAVEFEQVEPIQEVSQNQPIELTKEVPQNQQVDQTQEVPKYQQNSYNDGGNYKYNEYPFTKQNAATNVSKGFGIASLVLGIITILFSCTVVISFITGILAIIFGIIQINKKQAKGISISGIITGSVGLLLTILLLVFYISAANTKEFKNGFNEGYYNSIENQDSQYYENSSDL